MSSIVIASAARTPVGSFNGAFASTPAAELGKTAIQAALARAGVKAEDVSEVVLGQVLTATQGMNPARQASRAAGVPDLQITSNLTFRRRGLLATAAGASAPASSSSAPNPNHGHPPGE